MSRDIKYLVPELQDAFSYAKEQWQVKYPLLPVPFLTCTFRSFSEQNALYEQGRSKPGKIITYAKAGSSPHNRYPSFAFDIAFLTVEEELDWDKKLFKLFADIVKQKEGIEWGGDWKKGFVDRPHFQVRNWREK